MSSERQPCIQPSPAGVAEASDQMLVQIIASKQDERHLFQMAVDEIYRRHRDTVINIVLKSIGFFDADFVLPNDSEGMREVAEDLVQDVFLEVLNPHAISADAGENVLQTIANKAVDKAHAFVRERELSAEARTQLLTTMLPPCARDEASHSIDAYNLRQMSNAEDRFNSNTLPARGSC